MLDFLAEELASGFVGLIFRLVPPIRVEVESLVCQLPGNGSCEDPAIPEGRSRGYHAELLLVNRRAAPIALKEATLSINDKRYAAGGDVTRIRLEAREAGRHHIVFPISGTDIPDQEGHFKLTVTPAAGRTTTVTGKLPVLRE